MNRIIAVGMTVIALAGATVAMAAPKSRYIDQQRLDTDTLGNVNTIALLKVTDPEAYYGGGKLLGTASELLGVIGMIADIAEYGKDADQYVGTDFAQSLQDYLGQFLSENDYRVVDQAIERRDRFDLLDEYSGLEVAGADAYLDVALLEIGYFYDDHFVSAEIKPVATAIARLVSAETRQVIYARTFQYGDQPYIHSESEHMLSPEGHVYESKDDLDLDKQRAIERLDRALEVIAFNIARSVTKEKFVSHLTPTMEDISSTREDQAAVEFLGAAATEVAMKTYDEKLWRQSGELAGGDAQKQTEFYIKLRSKRLSEEERRGRLTEFSKLPGGIFDISGTYVSEITTDTPWRFKRAADRRLKITISQNGNEVIGTNKKRNLKISGVIEGDEISFFTWPSDISSDEIKGKWKIHPGGVSLTGKWRHPHGGGKWDLTRVE